MTWPKQALGNPPATSISKTDLPTTPMPMFCRHLAYHTIQVPDYDIATTHGKPVYQWADSPHLWLHTPQPEGDTTG